MYHNPERYLDYVRSLNATCKDLTTKESAAAILVVHGSCDYLVTRSSRVLAASWQQKHQSEPISLEAEKLDREGFFTLLQSEGLFESISLYVLKRAERCQDLASWIKSIDESNIGGNLLIINIHRPSLGAILSKSLEKLHARVIACHQPNSSQLGKVTQTLAKSNKISLSPDAISLIITNLGDDLSQIDNELRKLGLIFAEATQELTAAMIAPHLGLLREDEAFALDDLLTSKEYARAQILLTNLIERGQAPLAVLGILSRHCRNLLAVASCRDKAMTPRQIAAQLKLPVPVIHKFLNAVGKVNSKRAKYALAACQQCDLQLKSIKIPADLVLSRVIDELAACSEEAR